VFLEEARNKRQTEFKKTLQDFVLKVRGTTLQSGEVYEVLDSLEIETDVKRYVENLLTSYGIVRI